MTPKEKRIVEKHLSQIFATWHGCRLTMDKIRKNGNPKRSRLCDDCTANIKAHMQDISDATDL
jgi:hypothetical protein